MWNEILTKKDVEKLMQIFGGFHDSCLKELKYISGAYVNGSLSMSPFNSKRTLSIIFQRQYHNPSVIELEFSELEKLNLMPCNEDYTCEILGASMFIDENNSIFWYDDSPVSEPCDNYDGAWVKAKKARWRTVDNYIGDVQVFTYNI